MPSHLLSKNTDEKSEQPEVVNGIDCVVKNDDRTVLEKEGSSLTPIILRARQLVEEQQEAQEFIISTKEATTVSSSLESSEGSLDLENAPRGLRIATSFPEVSKECILNENVVRDKEIQSPFSLVTTDLEQDSKDREDELLRFMEQLAGEGDSDVVEEMSMHLSRLELDPSGSFELSWSHDSLQFHHLRFERRQDLRQSAEATDVDQGSGSSWPCSPAME